MRRLSGLTGAAFTAVMFVVAALPRAMTAQSRPRRGTESTPGPKTSAKKNSRQSGRMASREPPSTKAAPPSRVALLDDEAAWERLPAVEQTAGRRLPHWARALAGALPRTTAAMLQLDYLYRTSAAIDPKLRARMRWVAARANRCVYSQEYARADLLRAGAARQEVEQLEAGVADLPPDRACRSVVRPQNDPRRLDSHR